MDKNLKKLIRVIYSMASSIAVTDAGEKVKGVPGLIVLSLGSKGSLDADIISKEGSVDSSNALPDVKTRSFILKEEVTGFVRLIFTTCKNSIVCTACSYI